MNSCRNNQKLNWRIMLDDGQMMPAFDSNCQSWLRRNPKNVIEVDACLYQNYRQFEKVRNGEVFSHCTFDFDSDVLGLFASDSWRYAGCLAAPAMCLTQ